MKPSHQNAVLELETGAVDKLVQLGNRAGPVVLRVGQLPREELGRRLSHLREICGQRQRFSIVGALDQRDPIRHRRSDLGVAAQQREIEGQDSIKGHLALLDAGQRQQEPLLSVRPQRPGAQPRGPEFRPGQPACLGVPGAIAMHQADIQGLRLCHVPDRIGVGRHGPLVLLEEFFRHGAGSHGGVGRPRRAGRRHAGIGPHGRIGRRGYRPVFPLDRLKLRLGRPKLVVGQLLEQFRHRRAGPRLDEAIPQQGHLLGDAQVRAAQRGGGHVLPTERVGICGQVVCGRRQQFRLLVKRGVKPQDAGAKVPSVAEGFALEVLGHNAVEIGVLGQLQQLGDGLAVEQGKMPLEKCRPRSRVLRPALLHHRSFGTELPGLHRQPRVHGIEPLLQPVARHQHLVLDVEHLGRLHDQQHELVVVLRILALLIDRFQR